MFVDLASHKVGPVMRTDIAVVGSGPAGLSLARRLEAQGRDVLLIESGSLSQSDAAQELNSGEEAAGRDHYLRVVLREQTTADFAAGRVVRVQGWVISETEFLLFARLGA